MGANSALMDGYDLGEAIVTISRQYHWETGSKFVHHGGLSRAIKLYEDTMFPRAEKHAANTVRNRGFFHSENAAEELVNLTKNLDAWVI